jgi:hypothetical protein
MSKYNSVLTNILRKKVGDIVFSKNIGGKYVKSYQPNVKPPKDPTQYAAWVTRWSKFKFSATLAKLCMPLLALLFPLPLIKKSTFNAFVGTFWKFLTYDSVNQRTSIKLDLTGPLTLGNGNFGVIDVDITASAGGNIEVSWNSHYVPPGFHADNSSDHIFIVDEDGKKPLLLDGAVMYDDSSDTFDVSSFYATGTKLLCFLYFIDESGLGQTIPISGSTPVITILA